MIAYLASSVAFTVLFFELGGGHADIPFTMFPDYFVVAPVLPVLAIVMGWSQMQASDLLSVAAFVATFALTWIGTAVGARRLRNEKDPDRRVV
ncbi:hypothetical protein [Anaeromyxobacter oryzae]|uniref:hypothetical protein n=1 Tax=Anaeromyxobacter oryzae TaxID=2918170 RepID=UPI0020C17FFE|nr:hypothetical protein [Anaeromyxobacter oryzae]